MSGFARSEEVTMSVVRPREKLPTSRKPKVELTSPPIPMEELSIASLPLPAEEDAPVDGLRMVVSNFPTMEKDIAINSLPVVEDDSLQVPVIASVNSLTVTACSSVEAEPVDIFNEGCDYSEEDFMMDDAELLPNIEVSDGFHDIEASDSFHDLESLDDISQIDIDIEMETEQKPASIEPTSKGKINRRIQMTETERREAYLEKRRIRHQNMSLEERLRNNERDRIRRKALWEAMTPEEKENERKRRRQKAAKYKRKKREKRQLTEEQREKIRVKNRSLYHIRYQRRKDKRKALVLSPIEEIEIKQKELEMKERRKIRDRMQRESMSVEEWKEVRRKINEKRRARDALRSQSQAGSNQTLSKKKTEKKKKLALDNHNNDCPGNDKEVNVSKSNKKRTRVVELRRRARTPNDLLATEGTDISVNGDISLSIEASHFEGPNVEDLSQPSSQLPVTPNPKVEDSSQPPVTPDPKVEDSSQPPVTPDPSIETSPNSAKRPRREVRKPVRFR